MTFLVLKTLHILAVVIFLGNIITGLFWKAHGDRTGDPRIMAHTIDGIIRSDRWFTLPGVLAIIVFGLMAAMRAHLPIMGTSWIWQSLILFAVSGLAFVFQVAPLQVQLRTLAMQAADGGAWDVDRYRALSRRWELWGLLAVLTPLAALALMVIKSAS